MSVFLLIAAKSLLIAGIALLALKAMNRRSAADRSLIAHLGLGAIALLPVALFLLPQLQVAAPWVQPEAAPLDLPGQLAAPVAAEAGGAAATFPDRGSISGAATGDIGTWIYAAPAALLLLLTLTAVLRLVLLKAKANVLVEANWLTALARAQRRMGFKHGTALLTSDELSSPISWGLMRPVILLNTDAAKASDEAEAIIAHELAHVARLDWLKLLLSRVTVALFWFNPLVWMLAREAHQLREEAADDAVLASDIEDTDYARLLVGIARHECRGLLIGAHGVAPARNSLSRRVRRVLDAASARAPGGWRWTAAAGFFAAGMVVPLATLQFVPTSPAAANAGSVGGKVPALASAVTVKPPALTGALSTALDAASSATGAAASAAARAVLPVDDRMPAAQGGRSVVTSADGSTVTAYADGRSVVRSVDGSTITSYPDGRSVVRSVDGSTITSYPDGRSVVRGSDGRAVASASADGATAIAHVGPGPRLQPGPRTQSGPAGSIDRAIERKALGATPDYVRSIRAAAPHLRLDHDDIVEFAALGVSPGYLRDLASSGYPNLSADDVVEARAMGINGSYIREMSSAYGRLSMDRLVELRAVGVTARDIARYRRAAGKLPSVDKVVELKALGVTPEDLEAVDSP